MVAASKRPADLRQRAPCLPLGPPNGVVAAKYKVGVSRLAD